MPMRWRRCWSSSASVAEAGQRALGRLPLGLRTLQAARPSSGVSRAGARPLAGSVFPLGGRPLSAA
eukprot:6560203-Pyramimonas_sp.AAC.1